MKMVNGPQGEHLELTDKEISILVAARFLCLTADKLIRPDGNEEEDNNIFSCAAGKLGTILGYYGREIS